MIEADPIDIRDINTDIENCIKTESGLFKMPVRFKEGKKRQIGMDLERFPDREERPATQMPT